MRHLHVISVKTFQWKMNTWTEESGEKERHGPTAPPSGQTAYNTLLELPFSYHFFLSAASNTDTLSSI